ncbi:hypothetical protein PCE1_002386 [Barthelona sp. PCE]
MMFVSVAIGLCVVSVLLSLFRQKGPKGRENISVICGPNGGGKTLLFYHIMEYLSGKSFLPEDTITLPSLETNKSSYEGREIIDVPGTSRFQHELLSLWSKCNKCVFVVDLTQLYDDDYVYDVADTFVRFLDSEYLLRNESFALFLNKTDEIVIATEEEALEIIETGINKVIDSKNLQPNNVKNRTHFSFDDYNFTTFYDSF